MYSPLGPNFGSRTAVQFFVAFPKGKPAVKRAAFDPRLISLSKMEAIPWTLLFFLPILVDPWQTGEVPGDFRGDFSWGGVCFVLVLYLR